MKSIFDVETYQEVVSRIDNLHEGSKRNWGRMSVGQMVWHCQIPLKVAIENKKSTGKTNPFIQWFFKKSLYNDKTLAQKPSHIGNCKGQGSKKL